MPVALVTGATGQVGSHIVERLLGDGWEVRALVRTAGLPSWRAPAVQVVRGALEDPESLRVAAKGCDVVFHTAAAITAAGAWEAYRAVNVEGTRRVIEATVAAGARLVHLSSVAVYGAMGRYRDGGRRTDEDAPIGAHASDSAYARSKRESEALVMEAAAAGRLWATALRPDVIYGPRDRQFVPRMARLVRLGVVPILGGGRSTLAIVHAANVADGAVRAAGCDSANGRAYNLANDFDVTVRNFFTLGARGLGRTVRFLPVPISLARLGMSIISATDRALLGSRFAVATSGSLAFLSRDNPFSSDRARRELGWDPPVHPERGVPEAFASTAG